MVGDSKYFETCLSKYDKLEERDKVNSIKDAETNSNNAKSDLNTPFRPSLTKLEDTGFNYGNTITLNKMVSKSDVNTGHKILKGEASIQSEYSVLNRLGKGSFGTVFKVIHRKSNQIRAMKIVKKDFVDLQDDEKKFLKEIEILRLTDHPHIVRIFEYFEDKINYYIINEYLSGGELYDTIIKWKTFDETKARKIFLQIMSAVFYLHERNIIHRDLKPENIIVEKKKTKGQEEINIKIIDFGTCNFFKKSQNMSLKVGSPFYIAPEVLQKNYDEKCDVWSCGCILYVLLVGYPPFNGENTDEIFKNILNQKLVLDGEEWEGISKEAKDLVNKMLVKNKKKRLSAADCLNHPWLKEELESFDKKVDKGTMKRILHKIKNFHEQDKLQQATISYIVHFLCPPSEFEELRDIFRLLDKNHDGRLTYNELSKGFEQIFGKGLSEVELCKIMEEIDLDGDGFISYEEFLRVSLNKNKILNEKNLKLCFDSFDRNHDGKLSADEIRRVLGAKNQDYSKALIKLIDENGNDEIDFHEFKCLMTEVLRRRTIQLEKLSLMEPNGEDLEKENDLEKKNLSSDFNSESEGKTNPKA